MPKYVIKRVESFAPKSSLAVSDIAFLDRNRNPISQEWVDDGPVSEGESMQDEDGNHITQAEWYEDGFKDAVEDH